MNEDIRKWTDGRYTLMFDEHTFFVFDNEREKEMTALQTTEKLNEQQDNIKQLKEENSNLKELIKRKVFGAYNEGSLADLEFKSIAYDDIVKLEMSYESEPKLIVICKQGKKESVKGFCQMFIPFGVYYEIKELEE